MRVTVGARHPEKAEALIDDFAARASMLGTKLAAMHWETEAFRGAFSHADLVGGKRNKELMEPRHVAIWLTRELTDNTLADIGKRFGNRTHATIKHSIGVIDELSKSDRLLADRIARIRESITE